MRRLTITVGLVMMIAPASELLVQLTYDERPQFMLLGGMFLVGLLAVCRAVTPGRVRLPGSRPRDLRPRPTRSSGEPLWLSDDERVGRGR